VYRFVAINKQINKKSWPTPIRWFQLYSLRKWEQLRPITKNR